jgi:hypothetical protein
VPARARRGDTPRVGYEMFLVAVPAGGDVEETGEALLVRLARGHERTKLSAEGRERAETLAARLAQSEPGLARVPEAQAELPGAMELRAPTGLQVVVANHFARFLLPFVHDGAAAEGAFRQLFALLGAGADATGWRPYDPQEGAAVAVDDETCDAALEIYLSVMDQLRPAGPAGSARR